MSSPTTKNQDRTFDLTVNDVKYHLTCSNGVRSAEVFEYIGKDTKVSIPPAIICKKNFRRYIYPVTSVSATFSCSVPVTCIELPDTIETISPAAFRKCINLERFTIPKSVTRIEAYTFIMCHSLRSIEIPEGITSIGESAFNECISLRSVSLPSTLTQIDDYAFNDCRSLTSITIPASVQRISEAAFTDCFSLKSITLCNPCIVIDPERISGQKECFEDAFKIGTLFQHTKLKPTRLYKENPRVFRIH